VAPSRSRGATLDVTVTIRNQATRPGGVRTGFASRSSPPIRSPSATAWGSTTQPTPLDGGIFRGRPVTPPLRLQTSATPGSDLTRGQMIKGGQPFGETVARTIAVQ
jgi:hypothetical protein